MGVNLLLFRKSLKTGWKRLALVAGSVAVGIWILLSFTAFFNAISNRERYAFDNNLRNQRSLALAEKKITGIDPVSIEFQFDKWQTRDIQMLNIAKTGDNAPDMIGLKVPNPGEYYVSPALDQLIKNNPQDNIGSRYGHTQLGVLPESVVDGIDSLDVFRGVEMTDALNDAIKDNNGKNLIYSFSDKPQDNTNTVSDDLMNYIIYTGVIILILPVIMLISVSAKLGSIQREKRYAALRLVGATNGQIIRIIATESLISAILGVVIGTGLYLLSHPLLAQFSLEETRYWPDTISVTAIQYIVIVALTLLLVWLANWWGMRKIHTSPLGIAQNDHREKKPGWWRFIPLGLGLVLVGYVQSRGHAISTDESVHNTLMIMAAIVLIMFGLVLAGPWLTYTLSKLSARVAHNTTTIIGVKYVQSHARAISRSVVGVTLALFAGSFFLSATSGIAKLTAEAKNTNGYNIIGDKSAVITLVTARATPEVSEDTRDNLVTELNNATFTGNIVELPFYMGWSVGECKAVNLHLPSLDCGSKNKLVAVNFNSSMDDPNKIIYASSSQEMTDKLRKAISQDNLAQNSNNFDENIANIDASKPQTGIYNYLVEVSLEDTEKLRTAIANLQSSSCSVSLLSNHEIHAVYLNPSIDKLSGLVYAGIGVTMAVAIVSIVVSTTGGLLERRRSLYTLRLSGMQISELKRMVMVESLAPLVVTSLIAAGIGIWVAIVFIDNNSTDLRVNITPLYLFILFGSIVAATIAIYLVLPILDKITSPSNNQTE